MAEPTLATMMPDTDFFEIESKHVGTRFGIWVSRPPNYHENPDHRYAVVYVPDANLLFGSLAPTTSCAQDPIWPIEPVLQVMVGYTGDEAGDAGTLRNRDLLPPGEPVAPEMAGYVESFVEKGILTREEADAYLKSLEETHADRFLAFFEDELRPEIASQYRTKSGPGALFGYSYGGLFALYALLRRSRAFDTYGVSSPGIATDGSIVYEVLRERVAEKASFEGMRVHLTMGELEIVGRSEVYRTIGRQFVSIVEQLYQADLEGLAMSVEIIPRQTHITGVTPAHLQFLRTFYSA